MTDLNEKLLLDDPPAFVPLATDAEQQDPFNPNHRHHEHHHVAVSQHSSTPVGEKQPDGFRDLFAAILFIGHLIVILYLAIAWGFSSLNYSVSSYNTTDEIHFSGVLFMGLTASLAAFGVSAAALHIMTHYAEQLVETTLSLSIVFNVLLAIWFLWHNFLLGAVCALLYAAIGACYARAIWHRIPFAAANLKFALTAVRSNAGLVLVACAVTLLLQVWTIVWLTAWVGVSLRHAECDDGACSSHMNGLVILLFLLSYYWTSAVVKNVLHVTVSGVVGTYCFVPDDAGSFWAPCITDSLVRATTYSFGSICLGSLLTAILQVMHQICREARRRTHRHAFLLCVLECITSFLERIVVYFNRWSYSYIGLYGYDYLTAGQKVVELFRHRGWTTMITDSLVHRTLVLASAVVGLGTGAFGLVIAQLCPSWLEGVGGNTMALAFTLAFMIGTAVAYILFLSVVGAAVDTIIIVFTEAPLDLERNHPGLYRQMVAAWRQVYPEESRL
jgi:hypothetical protein